MLNFSAQTSSHATQAPSHSGPPSSTQVLNFSAQTSSHATQAMIESRLEKKRRQRFGAPAGKSMGSLAWGLCGHSLAPACLLAPV